MQWGKLPLRMTLMKTLRTLENSCWKVSSTTTPSSTGFKHTSIGGGLTAEKTHHTRTSFPQSIIQTQQQPFQSLIQSQQTQPFSHSNTPCQNSVTATPPVNHWSQQHPQSTFSHSNTASQSFGHSNTPSQNSVTATPPSIIGHSNTPSQHSVTATPPVNHSVTATPPVIIQSQKHTQSTFSHSNTPSQSFSHSNTPINHSITATPPSIIQSQQHPHQSFNHKNPPHQSIHHHSTPPPPQHQSIIPPGKPSLPEAGSTHHERSPRPADACCRHGCAL